MALALSSGAAHAVNKCTDASTGKVTYSDGPCASSEGSQRMTGLGANVLGAAAERPDHVRAAIAAKRPAVGMTLAELERAIGRPDKVNVAQYGAEFKDQLIYYTDTRTLYVYTTNGVVTAIQNTDGGRPMAHAAPVYSAPARQCPSAREIRDIEFEISKIENRGRPQVLAELHRQLGSARACGK